MAEGAGFEPAAQGLPVHGISSAAPSAARSPLLGSKDWRRGEDLNPRGTFWAPIRFRVGRLQPGSATPPHDFAVAVDSEPVYRSGGATRSRGPPDAITTNLTGATLARVRSCVAPPRDDTHHAVRD